MTEHLEKQSKTSNRLIVAITGASGVEYGIHFLEILQDLPVETHLIMSEASKIACAHETTRKLKHITDLADVVHDNKNIAAPIASGSFKTRGMVIAPCSIHTMSAIATGVTNNLITRTGDVMLKERRPLIMMVRETPLHLGHLRNMTALAEMGAIIAPPVPAFYAAPHTLEDMVHHSVVRNLDLLGFDIDTTPRWGEGKIKRSV